MSADNGPFAFVTSQFLRMIENRLWKLMLLGFPKIVVPHSDAAFLTNPTKEQLTDIKVTVEMIRKAKDTMEMRGKAEDPSKNEEPEPSHESKVTDETGAADEIPVPRLLSLGILPPAGMISLGILCEGDRKTISRLGAYLYGLKECPVEEIRQLGSLEEITGGIGILHTDLFHYLEEKFPPYSVNNLPDETAASLRDVLLAAYLHRRGTGTAFVHRHDWSVLHELWQAALPLKTDQAVPWIADMGFADTRELVNSVTNRLDMHALQLVDDVVRLEVPCFDDIPVSEILKYKHKDRFCVVVNRIQELRTSNGFTTAEQISEVIHDSLYEAFNALKPKASNLIVAIAGAAPVPIVNPFSLWSIGQELRENSSVRRRFDMLFVLSDLRRMSKRP